MKYQIRIKASILFSTLILSLVFHLLPHFHHNHHTEKGAHHHYHLEHSENHHLHGHHKIHQPKKVWLSSIFQKHNKSSHKHTFSTFLGIQKIEKQQAIPFVCELTTTFEIDVLFFDFHSKVITGYTTSIHEQPPKFHFLLRGPPTDSRQLFV